MNGHLGNVVLMGEEYKVDAGGVSLACQASGDRDAPPMVLLHALGEQAGSWAPVTARFAAHYRVVAVDLFDEKLDLARKLGAEFTVNAAKEDPVAAIQRLRLYSGIPVTSVSAILTLPSVEVSAPDIIFNRVVFPEPFAPTITTNSPPAISTETPFKAANSLK